MRAYPTSLAFKLGAHSSGANVVISSQSYMASSNTNQERLPSNDGAICFTCHAPLSGPVGHLGGVFPRVGQECIANHAVSLPLVCGCARGT